MPGCCCSPFEHAAGRHFNEKRAARELERYRRQGAGATTRLLQDGIAQAGALRGTVLDIGAGIGALTFALLDRGVTEAIVVDASAAYLAAARGEAVRRGGQNAIQFVHADFLAAASRLPAATVVALDRVVCCYPECESLLGAALEHARECVALSYPRDVWYVRAGTMLENRLRRLTRSSFRSFVHSGAMIERTITSAGFTLASRRDTRVWSADVYLRRPG